MCSFTTQRIVWDDQCKYGFNANDRDELYDVDADPHELTNLVDDPGHRDVKRRLAEQMWKIADDTGDDTFVTTDYGMFRFAPTDPTRASESSRGPYAG